MKFLDRVRKDIKNLPHDERQQAVQQQASWKAIVVLIFGYIAIGAFYAYKLETVPWSTQAIFFLAFITYGYFSIKQDGLSFVIPGMPETEATINQPAAIRSIPWLTFFGGLIGVFLGAVSGTAAILKINPPILQVVVFIALLLLVIFLIIINWAIAWQIKKGNPFWIRITFGCCVMNILGYTSTIIHTINHSFMATFYTGLANNPFPIPLPATAIFVVITTFWSVWVILKYRKQMIEDGKSYQKLAKIDAPKSSLVLKREHKTRELAIFSIAAFAIGFICLAFFDYTSVIPTLFFLLGGITLALTIIKSMIYD
jgi:hypothetical protein